MQTLLSSPVRANIRASLNQFSLTRTRAILLALTVIGTVLRFFSIGSKSIWLDEAYSIAITQRNLFDMLKMIVRADAHPPLYYLLLKIWLLPSNSEAWARSLSAIFSVFSIPLFYLLVYTLYKDKRAGLIAALILTFSPFHIWFAQEVRMYSALIFFTLGSLLFFFRALRGGAYYDWIGYIVMTTLALYTDNGAIWYLATLVCFSLIYIRQFWVRATSWILSHIAIGLLYALWLPFFFLQARQVTEGFWLPPPSFQTVLNSFLDFHSYNFPWVEISVVYMTTIFVFAYIVPGRSIQRRTASLLLFFPLVISILLSLRQPIFLSRNLIIASLGYYLLTMDTIWKFRSRNAALLFLIPLLVMNFVSIGRNYWFQDKENWREVAGMVAKMANQKPDGLIVFVPGFAELPFSYYFKDYGQGVQMQGYPGDELLLHPNPEQAPEGQEWLADYPYVWLVVRQGLTLDQDWVTLKEWLDSNGYERYPGFEHENVFVYSYFRWDRVKSRSNRNRFQSSHLMYFPLNMKKYTNQYVIQAGETLLEIAIRFETTVEALVNVNNIENPNELIPGQKLRIP